MRYFIFTILLIVPLLLTAQSKKEQIATLNLKVDSLFEVLVNNAQKLSDQRGEIFQLSQEKSDLEKSIVQISQEKLSLETEMSFKNSSLDTMQVQLQLAQDEVKNLLAERDDDVKNEILFNDYTGLAKLYDEAGELQYEIPFKDGKKEGIEIMYNKGYDGRIVIMQTPYNDGKKEGIEIEYNDGYGDTVIRETPYKDGKKEGEEFAQDGEGEYRIEYNTPYKDGKIEGECIVIDYYYMTSTGTLIKDGEIQSVIKYSENDEVLSKLVYKDGEIEEGTMASYDESGDSYQIIRYKSGEIISNKYMTCCDENGENYEIFRDTTFSDTSAPDFGDCGDLVSHEGYDYSTVQIGDQCWFSENCRYLPVVSPSNEGNTTDPYYYVYGYEGTDVASAMSTSNYATYGVLYNWPAVMTEGICPSGWHIPSDEEFTQLTDFLGGESIAGGKMKEAGYDHWNSPNTGATNSSGWTGLPGGFRYSGGFYYNGYLGLWWSASESGSYSWNRELNYSADSVYRDNSSRYSGFSARCVRDY